MDNSCSDCLPKSNTSAGSGAAFEDKIQVSPSAAIVLLNKD